MMKKHLELWNNTLHPSQVYSRSIVRFAWWQFHHRFRRSALPAVCSAATVAALKFCTVRLEKVSAGLTFQRLCLYTEVLKVILIRLLSTQIMV